MPSTKIEISLPLLGVIVSVFGIAATFVGGINAAYLSSINGHLNNLSESDYKHTEDINNLYSVVNQLGEEMKNTIKVYSNPTDYWAVYYDDDGKYHQIRLHRAQFFNERESYVER